MKKWTTLLLLSGLLAAGLAAKPSEEIIIEMHGAPSSSRTQPTLWNQNARQLSRRLRGQTRPQVLAALPVVSNKDRVIRSATAAYALVEYYDGKDFRKLLFHADEPQTFITAAATAADVLAVNKKYAVNLGLTQEAFEAAYPAAQTELSDRLPKQTLLYRMPYTDLHTPTETHWYLFEKGQLSRSFYTEADKDAYLQTLPEPAAPAAASAQTSPAPTAPARTVRKALISGGTEWDQMYLPRVINYKPAQSLTQE